MGLCQPVTVETESCGIQGDNLCREMLELEEGWEKEGRGGEREERIHSVAACHVLHAIKCHGKPAAHRGW